MQNEKIRVMATIKVRKRELKVWIICSKFMTIAQLAQQAVNCCQEYDISIGEVNRIDVLVNGVSADPAIILKDIIATQISAEILVVCNQFKRQRRSKVSLDLPEQHLKLVSITKSIDEYLDFKKSHRQSSTQYFNVIRSYIMERKGIPFELADLQKILYILPNHYIIWKKDGQVTMKMNGKRWRLEKFIKSLRKCMRKNGVRIPSLRLFSQQAVEIKRNNRKHDLDHKELFDRNMRGQFQRKMLEIVKNKENMIRHANIPINLLSHSF